MKAIFTRWKKKVGICWVEIEYGYIYFGMAADKWATSYSNSMFNVMVYSDWTIFYTNIIIFFK